jgi:putative peptidoglycan lipid II flippase
LRFVLDSGLGALRHIGKLYIPIALGLVVDMLGVALSYHLASRTGDQSIPWMQYSATVIQFPLGLVSIAVSIAILPTLSRQAASGESGRYRDTLNHGLRLVMALTIPATIGLWVLAEPIVALVFEHGSHFTPNDTQATVAALHCHLVGLIFAAIDQPLIFAFYARKDTWTPALVGVGCVVFYIVIALAPTLFGPLTLNGLILANSVKSAAHALVMLFLMRRGIGCINGRDVWRVVFKATLASVVMGAAVWLVVQAITGTMPPGGLREFILVVVGCVVGSALYGFMASILRLDEVADVVRMVILRIRALTAYRR